MNPILKQARYAISNGPDLYVEGFAATHNGTARFNLKLGDGTDLGQAVNWPAAWQIVAPIVIGNHGDVNDVQGLLDHALALNDAARHVQPNPDVLVKVFATIIVRVPNRHPDAQATDGLNEMFREAAGFVVDWGYAEMLGTNQRATVLSLDPDTYDEGDAWGTCPTCGALYGEMGHDPEPCEGANDVR